MRAEGLLLGRLMDLWDPVAARLMGPHINRRTVENVRKAELILEIGGYEPFGGVEVSQTALVADP
jgi:hypothetical protein